MKSCDRIRRAAFQYLEHSLPPSEEAEISTHLRQCAGCADAVAAARQTRQLLSTLPRHKASANFDIVLHARMRQAAHERQSFWPLTRTGWSWQIPAYSAAAVILIAAGALIDRKLDLLPSHPSMARIASIEKSESVLPTSGAAASLPATVADQPEARPRSGGSGEAAVGSNAGPALLTAALNRDAAPRQTAALYPGQRTLQTAERMAATRYVMERIPMQSLLRENRRTLPAGQADPKFDTMLVRQNQARPTIPGLRQATASVQF